MIAALFVERGGCYFGLPNVDPWPVDRDARLYGGPHPVVAHPPCERWGKFAGGSPLTRGFSLGDDDRCFAAAIWAVTVFGGVLEHPANSRAFRVFGLARPHESGGWYRARNGWVCHVEQGHYGHPARKATWLYMVGRQQPADLIWGPAPQRLPQRRLTERGYESARRCGIVANQSHNQRQRTPLPFRDLLISIAENAMRPAATGLIA